MAIDLYELIPKVRSALSDIPTNFITDDSVYDELEKSQAFCNMIVDPSCTEPYLIKCIVVLATYYAYVNYTTLSERQIGTVTPAAKIRVDALKAIALSFLQQVSMERLDENLVVDLDDQFRSRTVAMVSTPTVVDYDRYYL